MVIMQMSMISVKTMKNNESFQRLEVSTINCQDRYLETEEGLGFEELNNNTKGVDLEDNKEV